MRYKIFKRSALRVMGNAERRADLAIIGCGLIGGSIALSHRYAHKKSTPYIVAVEYEEKSKKLILQRGIADEIVSLREAARAKVCILATPAITTAKLFAEIAPHLANDTLLMDATSTKENVVNAARNALQDKIKQFVPCHPIAGSEKSGPLAARLGLFEGRYVIVNPLIENQDDTLISAVTFWHHLRAWVLPMDNRSHDSVFAALSHLPHMIAYALIGSLVAMPKRDINLAGSSFQELKRIALSNEVMWRDISIDNKKALSQRLINFENELVFLRQAIESEDQELLLKYFTQAKVKFKA